MKITTSRTTRHDRNQTAKQFPFTPADKSSNSGRDYRGIAPNQHKMKDSNTHPQGRKKKNGILSYGRRCLRKRVGGRSRTHSLLTWTRDWDQWRTSRNDSHSAQRFAFIKPPPPPSSLPGEKEREKKELVILHLI